VEQLGVATGEGRRFVLSELRYLREHAPLEIPSALLRTLTKFFAYHAGRSSGHLSPWLNRRLTSNSAYWRTRPG
jgi:rhamnosyltransferase